MPSPGSNCHTRVPRGSNQGDALRPFWSKRRLSETAAAGAVPISDLDPGGGGRGSGSPRCPLRHRCPYKCGPIRLLGLRPTGRKGRPVGSTFCHQRLVRRAWPAPENVAARPGRNGRSSPRRPRGKLGDGQGLGQRWAWPLRKPQTGEEARAHVAASGERQNFILRHGLAPCYQRRSCAFPLPSFAAP